MWTKIVRTEIVLAQHCTKKRELTSPCLLCHFLANEILRVFFDLRLYRNAFSDWSLPAPLGCRQRSRIDP